MANMAEKANTDNIPDPIDLVHLARQTMGDRDLEREVLQLFVGQAERLAGALEAAGDTMAKKRILHTMKGAARGVGAWEVADTASALEETATAELGVEALHQAIARATAFIATIEPTC